MKKGIGTHHFGDLQSLKMVQEVANNQRVFVTIFLGGVKTVK